MPSILGPELLKIVLGEGEANVAKLSEMIFQLAPALNASDRKQVPERLRAFQSLFFGYLKEGSLPEIRPRMEELCSASVRAGISFEMFVRLALENTSLVRRRVIGELSCEPKELERAFGRIDDYERTLFEIFAHQQSEHWREREEANAKIHADFFSNSILPAVTGSADLRILEVNPALLKHLPLDRNQVINAPLGMWLRTIGIPEAKVEMLITRLRGHGQLVQEELTIRRGERNEERVLQFSANFITNVKGERIGFQAMLDDVTERRRLEYQIESEKAQMEAVFNSSPVGLVFVDSERVIQQINGEACRLLNYPPPEEVERADMKSFRERARQSFKDPDGYTQLVEEVYSDPSASRTGNIEIARPERLIHYRVVPVVDLDEHPIGWLWTFVDITERTLNEKLKNDLTHMIVHDLKNPLTSIQGGATILKGLFGGRDEKIDQALGLVDRNCKRMLDMIMNLLDIERLETGKLELRRAPTPLAELVRGVLETQKHAAGGRDVRAEIPADLAAAKIEIDANLMERVITNLVSNAIKHTRPDGKIAVRAARMEGNGVKIEVADNGEGIPAEYHQKIFEKFGQAGMRQLGTKADTGLGLTFCKLATEAHGGRIALASELHKGSTFWIELPGEAGRATPELAQIDWGGGTAATGAAAT